MHGYGKIIFCCSYSYHDLNCICYCLFFPSAVPVVCYKVVCVSNFWFRSVSSVFELLSLTVVHGRFVMMLVDLVMIIFGFLILSVFVCYVYEFVLIVFSVN